MRASHALGLCLLVSLIGGLAPQRVQADQAQDWMIGTAREGDYVNLDLVFGAVQSTYEHRENIYGNANMLKLRAGGVVAVPFTSAQADVDMRMLNLNLGVSGGYSNVWRNMTFEDDEPMDRKQRRERDAAGDFNTEAFPFFEFRAGLPFAFNDYVVFNHVTAFRFTGAPERSFDYQANLVHDGKLIRTDLQLFIKHRDWGGIAPMFQILNFPLRNPDDNDNWRTQYNFGFFAVTRAGLVGRDDLLALQVLFHSEALGGYDNEDVYGWALLRGPVSFLLAYRSVIEL